MTASHHVTLKDLLDCKLLSAGEILGFKGETGVITPEGNIAYQKNEYSSLSRWAKEVASKKGLSKHYNGWKVVHTRNRPLYQFRDQFYAFTRGQPYTFPQPVVKKRRRRSASVQPRKRQRCSGKDVIKEPPEASVCEDPSCILCQQGPPASFSESLPTWADILRVVLYLLAKKHPNQQFFSLSNEIYPFISSHFEILECDTQSVNWKQTVKMTLSHARYAHLFESGYEALAKTGHWRLKPGINPYANQLQALSSTDPASPNASLSTSQDEDSNSTTQPSPPVAKSDPAEDDDDEALQLTRLKHSAAKRSDFSSTPQDTAMREATPCEAPPKKEPYLDPSMAETFLAELLEEERHLLEGPIIPNDQQVVIATPVVSIDAELQSVKTMLQEERTAHLQTAEKLRAKAEELKTLNSTVDQQIQLRNTLEQELSSARLVITQLRAETERLVQIQRQANDALERADALAQEQYKRSFYEISRLQQLVSTLTAEVESLRRHQDVEFTTINTNESCQWFANSSRSMNMGPAVSCNSQSRSQEQSHYLPERWDKVSDNKASIRHVVD